MQGIVSQVGVEIGQNVSFPGIAGQSRAAGFALARRNQGILPPLAEERQVNGNRDRHHIAIGWIASAIGCADPPVGPFVGLGQRDIGVGCPDPRVERLQAWQGGDVRP